MGKYAPVTYWHWAWNVAFESTFLQWERIWSRINSLTLLNGPKAGHKLAPANWGLAHGNTNHFLESAAGFSREKILEVGKEKWDSAADLPGLGEVGCEL